MVKIIDRMSRVVALIFIILLGPVLVLISIVVKLSDGGNVFYSQWRIGADGREFRIYKFRTMYVDLAAHNPLKLSYRGDPRITPRGRILRKYKLDELPQLWNVFIGDMKWFGPRPEQAYYVDLILSEYPSLKPLYTSKPGLIPFGVLKCGYSVTVSQMVRRAMYDRVYRQHKSFLLHVYMVEKVISIVCKGNSF